METQQSEPNGIGHNRPTPSFKPSSVAAAEVEVQQPAGAQDRLEVSAPSYGQQVDAGAPNENQQDVQLDETANPLPHSKPSDYIIPVDEVLIRLRDCGIEKSKDSVQRYCREGALDCQKLGLFKRYFATEKSLDALIKKMQPDEAACNSMQLDAPAPIRDVVNNRKLDAPASNGTQLHQAADEPQAEPEIVSYPNQNPKPEVQDGMMEFLKEEIRVKNTQLEVKDNQIAAMLERDRETNILIRGLQNQLGETFAMLAGRTNREATTDENATDFRN